MSTSYSADLIVGFPLSKVLQREEYAEEVTKYNEDTGKPYTKEITKVRYIFNGEEVDIKEHYNTYTGAFAPYHLIETKLGLEIYNERYNYYTDEDYYKRGIVGKRIKSVEDYSEVSLDQITKELLNVSQKLIKANIPNIDVKIYLALDVG